MEVRSNTGLFPANQVFRDGVPSYLLLGAIGAREVPNGSSEARVRSETEDGPKGTPAGTDPDSAIAESGARPTQAELPIGESVISR